MENETVYMPIAVTPEVKERIKDVAKAQRRSMSQQAGKLIELGLAEYERMTKAEGFAAEDVPSAIHEVGKAK